MPNWIEGTLKLRGKTGDILRFLNEGINVYVPDFTGETIEYHKADREKWCKESHEDDFHEYHLLDTVYIEGTKRAFLDAQSVYIEDDGSEQIVVLDVREAWGFHTEYYVPIAKEYNLDMRAFGIECGMQVCQEFEILNGEITMDKDVRYNNWDWECPLPKLGG